MVQTVIHRNMARFGINLNDVTKKTFYYFIQPDKSVGVGSYAAGNGSTIIDRSDQGLTKETATFNINEAKKQMTEFKPQKTSFHISGISVTKDAQHTRSSDDSDMISIPFSEIKDPKNLRIIYPSRLDNYKTVKKTEVVNIFNARDCIPLMIQLHIAPSSYDFEGWLKEKVEYEEIYFDNSSLQSIGLSLYVTFRKSNNNFIPSHEVSADFRFEF